MTRVLIVTLALSLLAAPSYSRQKYKADVGTRVKLDSKRPSVYVSFERTGQTDISESETRGRVWLRLHNNTRWVISIRAYGVPSQLGDLGVYYTVKKLPGGSNEGWGQTGRAESERPSVPVFNQAERSGSIVKLAAGNSLLFSVPEEHIFAGLMIEVPFNFEWEDYEDVVSGREVEHIVRFSSRDLP